MILIKTSSEIERMRVSGRILASVLAALKKMIQPGVTTGEIEAEANRMIIASNSIATFRGQPGMVPHAPPFPAATCISVNEEIIHGIPSSRKIREGDLVSIDCGVTHDGFIADSAVSAIAGQGDPDIVRLMNTTERSLYAAIEKAWAGNHLHDLSFAVQSWAVAEGFGIVKDFCGHGVGRNLHEDPPIPNYGRPGSGPILQPGMTLAIEPMLTLGNPKIKVMKDGWTVVTADKKPAAHFEHTILITEGAPEILTDRTGL